MSEARNSYWSMIEPLFSAIDTGNGAERFASTSAQEPRSAVLLFAAHMTLAEVHNGGLLQLFWNETGVLVPEAIEGFKVIEMGRTAAILTRAALLLGSAYPRDRNDRWDALLVASSLESQELEVIFAREKNLYLAFAEATESLALETLGDEFWESAKTDNGGFQHAATRYAQLMRVVQ
jgi:Domain of unknown function (DUF4375)